MRGRVAQPLKDKFWRRVLPLSCGCWIWTGCGDRDAYGFVRHGGKNLRVHRVSYEMHKGSAKGLEVLHTCDNPACCNPEHLFLGTNQDNQLDAVAKGRHRYGTIMNEEKADAIRKDRKEKSLLELSKEHGVSQASISRICNFKRWQ